jgi:hypothetical protein
VKVYTIRRSHRNGVTSLQREDTFGGSPRFIDPKPGYLFQYGYHGTGPRHLAEQLLRDCFQDPYAAVANASSFAMTFFGPASRAKDRIEITQREVLRWLSNRIAAGATA